MKVSAAGAAGVAGMAGLDWQIVEPAFATSLTPDQYDTFHTTCPYCSASCGQVVAVAKAGTPGYQPGDVIDIWGDKDSPINNGGLCAKGAGAYQLVNNPRRLGAWDYSAVSGGGNGWEAGSCAKEVLCHDAAYDSTGLAWKRIGNGDWTKMTLTSAMTEIAGGLVSYRDVSGAPVSGVGSATNAKSVQFFGCSHMNNEPNYLYRKIIANFGTSLVEHQARI